MALQRVRVPLAGRVALVFVPDEETGGQRGSGFLAATKRLGTNGIGMLTPEPTSGAIWNANRGAVTVRVTVHGREAHVGVLHQGRKRSRMPCEWWMTAEEMNAYRAPFGTPESRLPTLVWPRELPIEGEPADVVQAVQQYGNWLAASTVPKLFVAAEPGALITGRARDFCRTFP